MNSATCSLCCPTVYVQQYATQEAIDAAEDNKSDSDLSSDDDMSEDDDQAPGLELVSHRYLPKKDQKGTHFYVRVSLDQTAR